MSANASQVDEALDKLGMRDAQRRHPGQLCADRYSLWGSRHLPPEHIAVSDAGYHNESLRHLILEEQLTERKHEVHLGTSTELRFRLAAR